MSPLTRRIVGVAYCLVLPLWVFFFTAEQFLFGSGMLNTKDLPPIGRASGTFTEYLLNVWYWDGVLFAVLLGSLPCLIIGCLLLRSLRKARRKAE
jgi:hypothetical protein